MKRKRLTLNAKVRQVVNASGMSRYAICKAAGVDQAAMSRFMAGKCGLNLKTLDALADVLRLDVVVRGPAKVLPRERPGRKPKTKKESTP